MSAAANNVVPALVASVIVWRVMVRIRRSIGRQLLHPRRMKGQMLVLSLIALVMASLTLQTPLVLAGLIGGLALGAPLGRWGLRLTRFEKREDGFYYTPNMYLGIGLSLLLIARLAYRFAVLNGMTQSIVQPAKGFMQSPLTLFMFGVIAGYYVVYNSGVLKRSKEETGPAATTP